MPSFLPGYLIKEVRMRKRWQQSQVLSKSVYEHSNLSKVENIRQDPLDDTFRFIMDEMYMPVEGFFCPYLENQLMDAYVVRDQILNLLDADDPTLCQEAEKLVNALESRGGFEDGINRQFILSCRARLNELKQLDPVDTLSFTKEGMSFTHNEFDELNFEGDILVFEEPTLLHTLALAYHRIGDTDKAIALLRRIHEGINRLPEDDHEKEKKLAPVLLTLSDFLIQEEKYSEALNVCLLGNIASIKRNKGKYTPNFVYNKAVCNLHMGNKKVAHTLLQQAYFGYALLRKKEKTKQVLEDAQKRFGIQFNTYGVENLIYEEFDPAIGHGEPVTCDNIGSLIAILRHQAGITQKKLCQGICSQPNLNRIENGKIQANVYYLEAFMQRLGRDINKYLNTFPSIEDFKCKQIRDEINSRIISLDFESAAELLEELKTKKPYKSGVNLQFVKNAEATIFASREGFDHPKYLDMLKEAMAITKPDFDENMVDRYRLTYYEVILINEMAIHYGEAGKVSHSVKLFERLKDSMNRYYVDEKEKIRMYTTALYNYSKFLGLMERHKEALEIINEGEILELKHSQLTLLPYFAVNRAYNLLELGKKEESVPIFAMAYYGSDLFGNIHSKQVIANHVKERLGINFD